MTTRRCNHEEIVLEYNNGVGTNEIARKLNVHRVTIQRILKSNNIKLRKGSPRPNHKYNINFFKEFNQQSCYWAGFIAADGCVRSDRAALEIGLKKSDKKQLENFLKSLNLNKKIYEEKSAYRISVAGNWLLNDLKKNFGIESRKSLTLEFSKKIPKSYYKDFIRGYFDGDGCITHSSTICISFVGTKNFLNRIREICYTHAKTKIKRKYKYPNLTKNGNVYSVSYSGKNAIKVLNWLYEGSQENIRLQRKYEKFLKEKDEHQK